MGRRLSRFERSVRRERRQNIAIIAVIIAALLIGVLYVGVFVAMGDGAYKAG